MSSQPRLEVQGKSPFKQSGVFEVQISISDSRPSDEALFTKKFPSLWRGNFHLRVKDGMFSEKLGSPDNPLPSSIETLDNLEEIKTDRVELYTYDFAHYFDDNKTKSIEPYLEVVNYLNKKFSTVELNAGHDLNLKNLEFFLEKIANIKEVSIGHALICDTFDIGLKETIKKYLSLIKS